MGLRRKEKLRMLILDGFRMRSMTCRGRSKINLMSRIKKISNKIISQCNKFQRSQEIKIFKLPTKMKVECLFIQSKYYYLYLLTFQIHTRLRESSLRSSTFWNCGTPSCQKNHFDGPKKAYSIQSKKQPNAALIETNHISKQIVSHARERQTRYDKYSTKCKEEN